MTSRSKISNPHRWKNPTAYREPLVTTNPFCSPAPMATACAMSRRPWPQPRWPQTRKTISRKEGCRRYVSTATTSLPTYRRIDTCFGSSTIPCTSRREIRGSPWCTTLTTCSFCIFVLAADSTTVHSGPILTGSGGSGGLVQATCPRTPAPAGPPVRVRSHRAESPVLVLHREWVTPAESKTQVLSTSWRAQGQVAPAFFTAAPRTCTSLPFSSTHRPANAASTAPGGPPRA
mmetsp:Transcript_44662/g.100980  ORF Transcript_44662/g.100980 Transcript_44662/m.100980 type:complete len:232 (-) Transcript_44662:273-968(-)